MEDERPSDWSGVAAGFLLLAGIATAASAIAAIGGSARLEANVRDIESGTVDVYASLATWGWVLMIVAVGEISAAVSIWRRTPNRILAGLIAGYVGLLGSFLTIAILRVAGLPARVLLFAAVYVLAYRSGRRLGG